MLRVDATLTDDELVLFVREECTKIGTVKSVTIYRRPKLFALVEMATAEESRKLAARLGRPPIGQSVVLHFHAANDGRTHPVTSAIGVDLYRAFAILSC
jgi:hypothetical protein